QGPEQVRAHLLQLASYQFVLPLLTLGGEPKDPVPEVLVDPVECVRGHRPGRERLVRFAGEDEVHLDGPGQHEHVTGIVADPIPLLRQGVEGRDQRWERSVQIVETVRHHDEVPIRQRGRRAVGARSDQLDPPNGRMWEQQGLDRCGDVHHGSTTYDVAMPKIVLLEGDLTTQDVDAIVNAANSTLLGGGGVDGAIHRAGGPSILTECEELRRTTFPDGLPTGRAVATGGGDLPARWVIHTGGP